MAAEAGNGSIQNIHEHNRLINKLQPKRNGMERSVFSTRSGLGAFSVQYSALSPDDAAARAPRNGHKVAASWREKLENMLT